jgi:hypothetical protein
MRISVLYYFTLDTHVIHEFILIIDRTDEKIKWKLKPECLELSAVYFFYFKLLR